MLKGANNFTGGAIVGAVVCFVIFVTTFIFYGHNTSELNDNQRFRAVCEYQGGKTVENYCIKGNSVITIDLGE
jgi:hypothetical protein